VVKYERVSTLQFIASITGHLAWPLAIVALGLIFKQQIKDLMKRVRRLTWRESTAELVEATEDVKASIEQAASLLPQDDQVSEAEREQEHRRRIEQVVRYAAKWGFQLARDRDGDIPDLLVKSYSGDDLVISTLPSWWNIHEEVSRKSQYWISDKKRAQVLYRAMLEVLIRRQEEYREKNGMR
jgi:hypothetical protein